MPALHETTSDHVKRVFSLYLAICSAGSMGLFLTIFLALPDMQRRIGPYIWILPLGIFLLCFAWVAVAEYRRYRQRLRYTPRVAITATYNIAIKNEAGDTELIGFCEVINRGKVPLKNLPGISVGYHVQESQQPSLLELKVKPPDGKDFKLRYSYCFHTDDNYIVYVWNYQIPQGLESGEKIEYSYVLPAVPGSEADAFTDRGGCIILDSRLESYDQFKCYVTAPSNYKFTVLETKVLDEFSKVNPNESKRVQKSLKPQVPREYVGNRLRWHINSPFPRHEYVCKYKLTRL